VIAPSLHGKKGGKILLTLDKGKKAVEGETPGENKNSSTQETASALKRSRGVQDRTRGDLSGALLRFHRGDNCTHFQGWHRRTAKKGAGVGQKEDGYNWSPKGG